MVKALQSSIVPTRLDSHTRQGQATWGLRSHGRRLPVHRGSLDVRSKICPRLGGTSDPKCLGVLSMSADVAAIYILQEKSIHNKYYCMSTWSSKLIKRLQKLTQETICLAPGQEMSLSG
jgi:hypothetical protein